MTVTLPTYLRRQLEPVMRFATTLPTVAVGAAIMTAFQFADGNRLAAAVFGAIAVVATITHLAIRKRVMR